MTHLSNPVFGFPAASPRSAPDASIGALTRRTLLVHCVWVDEEDLSLIAERGARIVHNPSANAFLGDGIAPLREMLARSIPVALGTDGGCTNSRQSVFAEMRRAALFSKAGGATGAQGSGPPVSGAERPARPPGRPRSPLPPQPRSCQPVPRTEASQPKAWPVPLALEHLTRARSSVG